jgi:hypothetical protein
VVPGAAEHPVVLEQAPVDELRDLVKRAEGRDRAHLERLEVPADLLLGGEPQRAARLEQLADLAQIQPSEAGITASV